MTILDEQRQEQSTTLVITDGVHIQQTKIYSTCFSMAYASIADVRWQAEVTNPYQFNVGIGSVLRGWDYAPNGEIVSFDVVPPVMSNVTPEEHHKVISGSYLNRVKFQYDGTVRCYALMMWAVSDGGSGVITVEKGYGYLQVKND